MLSHEVNNHKPTEKMLISFTFCPIKIVIFAQTTLYEHERSFCDNASLWIYFSPAEHKTNGEAIFCQFLDCSSCGKGREGYKTQNTNFAPAPLGILLWLFTYVREMTMRGGPISPPLKIQEEKRFDHCSYNTASWVLHLSFSAHWCQK